MERKKQFKWFTIFEYEKEQEYLRQMHKSGWKFLKVSGLGVYHFEKCTPQDVVYQLDYNKEGLAQKEEYLQMFHDCGWEYLQEYAGYSYFRKPVSEDGFVEEIFCDEESRLHMMERVIKGRMLPLVILFSCVLVPQFIIHLLSLRNFHVAAAIGAAILVYVAAFIVCGVKYMQYKNKATR